MSPRGRRIGTIAPRVKVASVLALGLAAAAGLSACTAKSPTAAANGSTPSTVSSSSTPAATSAPASTAAPTPTPPPAPAVITTSWRATSNVNPAAPLSVSVAGGKLTSVKIVNPTGTVVTGALDPTASTWTASEALGYSKTYTLKATAVNPDGKVATKSGSFTTLTPGNQTMPYLQILGGASLTNGATYGVAIVPVIHFDEPIADKAAATKALQVVSSVPVTGAWYWVDDQDVHYRPQSYWPAGAKVTINANVYGVNVGNGLYGQSDVSGSFVIGRKQVTVAYDSAPQVDKVYVYNAAGTVIRTMDTSMGKHGGEQVGSNWINFYTPGGTYTVLDHEQPAKMCSASYGLPADAPGGYACEDIYNATKISIDGIYLHLLNSTVWDQENGYDVSHGCLNLDEADSQWFFDHSIAGDPVVIHPTKGAPALQLSEGGDWSVPWSTWVKGGYNN